MDEDINHPSYKRPLHLSDQVLLDDYYLSSEAIYHKEKFASLMRRLCTPRTNFVVTMETYNAHD